MRGGSRQYGFTLIEIIVAILVFSVLSVLSYRAVDSVLEVDQRSKERFATQASLQKVWHRLFNDFIHLVNFQNAIDCPITQY